MIVYREFVTIAADNLGRMKLRTALTTSGIAIGIAALVAMLSFAFGIQKNVAERFRSLGLFHMLQVMPPASMLGETAMRAGPHEAGPGVEPHEAESGAGALADSGRAAPDTSVVIDDGMLARIATIDGVAQVIPQDTFDAQLEHNGHQIAVTAQAMPASFVSAHYLGSIVAGRFFDDDSSAQIVLARRTARRLGVDADSIIGQKIVVRVAGRAVFAKQVIENAIAAMKLPPAGAAMLRTMASAWLGDVGPGTLQLEVCGVADFENDWGFQVHDALIPSGVVAGMDRLSVNDPFALIAELTSPGRGGYALATVVLDEHSDHAAARDAIEDLGLRTLSFVEEFERVKRSFLIFDLMVGVLGFIALFVASLGITNTMVMSISERRREIGILKALGAEDAHVRSLFLVESALIGLLGSVGGLIFGWLISRGASFVARQVMASQDVPVLDLFYLPPLVAAGAVAFGVALSLVAGLHPASRAARTDPVRALRDL